MKGKHILTIFAILSLLVPMASFDVLASHGLDKREHSTLTLDQIEQCTNTMQCNAKVFTGDTIKFTGMLTDNNDLPLHDEEVRISVLIPTPEIIVLTTTMTDVDGIFTAEWTAKLSRQSTAFQDVTRQFLSEGLEVFAEFTGDEKMAPSKSKRLSMTVTVNTVHTTMNSDKTQYQEGDTVLIFLAFLDSNDEFIDPDTIRASWNNKAIELEKKKEGSYTFTIENLERQHQQIIVVPDKAGLNANTAFLTLIVEGLR